MRIEEYKYRISQALGGIRMFASKLLLHHGDRKRKEIGEFIFLDSIASPTGRLK